MAATQAELSKTAWDRIAFHDRTRDTDSLHGLRSHFVTPMYDSSPRTRSANIGGIVNKVLLIDDDVSLLEMLSLAFADAGFAVLTAADGAQGYDIVVREAPNAIVSDVNMPRLDGFTLTRKLRSEGRTVPIVLLTSRDNEIDEALGLELGADDYVAKPFSTRVLLARVGALLRRDALRSAASEKKRSLVRAGALELDTERLEARLGGTLLTLTLTEFRILEAFAERPGIVLSRTRLLEIVRGDDSVVAERIVDTYVRRLRRLFETHGGKADAIETVVGVGYRFRAEPSA